jgi:hypothetical protein
MVLWDRPITDLRIATPDLNQNSGANSRRGSICPSYTPIDEAES